MIEKVLSAIRSYVRGYTAEINEDNSPLQICRVSWASKVFEWLNVRNVWQLWHVEDPAPSQPIAWNALSVIPWAAQEIIEPKHNVPSIPTYTVIRGSMCFRQGKS